MLKFVLIVPGIPLLTALWWLWADRRVRPYGRGWRIGIAAAMTVVLVCYGWILTERRDILPWRIPPVLYSGVLLWAVILLPLMAVPMMALWALWQTPRRLKQPSLPPTAEGPGWTRRRWLGGLVTTLPIWSTVAATFYSLPQMKRFRVRKMTLQLPSLPPALDGLRIAHVTDTHVGKFTTGKVLDEIVHAVNALDADLILFTGDLIDNRLVDLPEAIAMMKRLKSRDGMFLIEGNHDRFDDPVKFTQGVRAAGLTLLQNQVASISVRGVPVQIAGIMWHSEDEDLARCVDMVAGMKHPDAFPILMAHHPHAFDRAVEQGYPLVLAGHTHGGQLMVTDGFGAGSILFRYWSGLYRKSQSQMVVSNGTGNWFPLRVHAPAEIIDLTLRKA